jgi:ubiquinone/menaquinone biosynthesis C-methylase UbiE
MNELTPQQIYTQLYDQRVPDWEGELDFYRSLIHDSSLKANGVLEIACGTGRVAIQLAKEGIDITGMDLSAEMLDVAKTKSGGIPNLRWAQGDMRTFDLGKKFGIIISPGHSFQFMSTPEDQVQCLETLKRHLVDGGLLVLHLDHQDYGWLAELLAQTEPVHEKGRLTTHPQTGRRFRASSYWTFEPATQNATSHMSWEEVDDSENVIQILEMEPKRLHCIFRFEMEHLLHRVGFSVEAVYGDFFKHELTDSSGQMIWVAKSPSS